MIEVKKTDTVSTFINRARAELGAEAHNVRVLLYISCGDKYPYTSIEDIAVSMQDYVDSRDYPNYDGDLYVDAGFLSDTHHDDAYYADYAVRNAWDVTDSVDAWIVRPYSDDDYSLNLTNIHEYWSARIDDADDADDIADLEEQMRAEIDDVKSPKERAYAQVGAEKVLEIWAAEPD